MPNEDDNFTLSPESSQYPEGAGHSGGDSTVLESQKLSFNLWKKLKEISPDDDLIAKDGNQQTKTIPKPEKKSYSIESENPYFKAPTTSNIVTGSSSINNIIKKIEDDIIRKRKATDMEEFFDENGGSKNDILDQINKPVVQNNKYLEQSNPS